MPNYGINSNGMPNSEGQQGGASCPGNMRWDANQQACVPRASAPSAGTQPQTPQVNQNAQHYTCPQGWTWAASQYDAAGQCVQTPGPGVTTPSGPGNQSTCPAGTTPSGGGCIDANGNTYAPGQTPPAPPPGTTTTPPPSGGGGGPFDISKWGQGWTSSGGRTLQDWTAYWAAHPEAKNAGWNLSGSKQDKIVGPDGRIYDMVFSGGTGGAGAQMLDVTHPGGGQGGLGAYLLNTQPSQTFPWSSPPPPNWTPGTYTDDASKKATSDLIMKMLTTTSMSPEVVAQMRERQKESILDMSDQVRQQLLGSAAQRGVLGGGSVGTGLSGIDMKSVGDISSAYRDIDVSKATQDRTDQQNAVAASNAFNTELFNEFLGEQGLQEKGSQDAFYNWLAQQGINLDWLKFLQNNQLDVAKFLAG